MKEIHFLILVSSNLLWKNQQIYIQEFKGNHSKYSTYLMTQIRYWPPELNYLENHDLNSLNLSIWRKATSFSWLLQFLPCQKEWTSKGITFYCMALVKLNLFQLKIAWHTYINLLFISDPNRQLWAQDKGGPRSLTCKVYCRLRLNGKTNKPCNLYRVMLHL